RVERAEQPEVAEGSGDRQRGDGRDPFHHALEICERGLTIIGHGDHAAFWKLGGRFSRKAAKASLGSSERTRWLNSRPSPATASRSCATKARLISRLDARSAPAGFEASFRAVSFAVARPCESG